MTLLGSQGETKNQIKVSGEQRTPLSLAQERIEPDQGQWGTAYATVVSPRENRTRSRSVGNSVRHCR